MNKSTFIQSRMIIKDKYESKISKIEEESSIVEAGIEEDESPVSVNLSDVDKNE